MRPDIRTAILSMPLLLMCATTHATTPSVVDASYRHCAADADCTLVASTCLPCTAITQAANTRYKDMDFAHCTKQELAAIPLAMCSAVLTTPVAKCEEGLCIVRQVPPVTTQ